MFTTLKEYLTCLQAICWLGIISGTRITYFEGLETESVQDLLLRTMKLDVKAQERTKEISQ